MTDTKEDKAPETGLIVLDKKVSFPMLFAKPELIDNIIAGIEKQVDDTVPDLSTAKGRDACRSLAAKVAKSKVFLDKKGKELNEDAQAQIHAVNTVRKDVTTRLDAIRDKARQPLTDWEEADEKLKAEIAVRIDALSDTIVPLDTPQENMTVALKEALLEIAAVDTSESFGDQEERAEIRRSTAMMKLEARIDASVQRDKDMERLAELEAADAERKKKDAADEADRLEKERVDREAKDAADLLEKQKVREAEIAQQAQLDAEAAQAAEVARVKQKALDDVKAAVEKAEQAAADERKKIEDEAAAKAKSLQKVAKKKELIKRIGAAIARVDPKDIARAIVEGEIPNVQVYE